MYYQIKETLTPCDREEIKDGSYPYVANISLEEFNEHVEFLDMGIDSKIKIEETTHVKTTADYMVGGISIPNRTDPSKPKDNFGFVVDRKGIVFLNDKGIAQNILDDIQNNTKWRKPSFEYFMFDFLESIVENDLDYLEKYDQEMEEIERKIFEDDYLDIQERLSKIRRILVNLSRHYERLMDLGDKFYANTSGFFHKKNLGYFEMFSEHVNRLLQYVESLKEYTIQIRDLYRTKIDEKQNKSMAVLTTIATIFTPITILTGWYGMNFSNMPELNHPYAYPILMVICFIIIVTSLIVFKKKKLL